MCGSGAQRENHFEVQAMRKETPVNKFAKITLGALVVAGATLAATAGAEARVSVGIGIGPGY